ncbi:MAG: malate/lactate/ureidoglycolate dehydrogenase, partial [Gemmatimonadaceae bacterium]|nr:malate/lactate/ureidoglycolate dehydrogenase [Acetobacteraceae bacterium]
MDALPTTTVPAATLRRFIADIFTAAGCNHGEAGRIGHHLVSANLAGHDSHGVIRVPRYVDWLHDGKVRANQTITIVTESATHAVVDANLGFGQTTGPLAVDLGIGKARAAGLSVVTLRNSGHIGRIGDWAERAAEAGLVSIHFVNVGLGEVVAPFGGVDRRFGTNPLCIGVPQPGGPPLLLDFATSMVAEGKVLVASNGGKPIPHGALIGPDGALSSDPRTLYGPIDNTHVRDPGNGDGALRAFGDHKGSGIAFMCEILAGCFAGSPTAGPLADGKRGGIVNGMLSIYLDPGHFGAAGFAETARAFAEHVRASRPAAPGGEVLAPGDAESRIRT